MRTCPNCGREVTDADRHCPNCGAEIPVVWPPPLAIPPSMPTGGKLITKSPTADVVLGVVISVASFAICLGIIAMPILYLMFSRTYPSFTRGIGWGWLVVVLGGLTVCFGPTLLQQILHGVGH